MKITKEILKEYRKETLGDEQAKDQELIEKQILENQKIVNSLLNFHSHCGEMLDNNLDLLKVPELTSDREKFLEDEVIQWTKQQEQIEEMIQFATGKNISTNYIE